MLVVHVLSLWMLLQSWLSPQLTRWESWLSLDPSLPSYLVSNIPTTVFFFFIHFYLWYLVYPPSAAATATHLSEDFNTNLPFPLKLGPKVQFNRKPWNQEVGVFLCLLQASVPSSYLSKGSLKHHSCWSGTSFLPDSLRGWCVFHKRHHYWPTSDLKYWCVSWLWVEGSKSREIRWNTRAPGSFTVRRRMFLWNLWLNKCSIFHLPLTQHIFLLSTFVWIAEKKVRINVEQDTFRHHSQKGGAGRHTAALHDKKGSLASFL